MIVDVEFIRTAVGGVVHVLDARLHDDFGVRQVARCGRLGRPNVAEYVTEFVERELCPSCWAATPAEQRPRLVVA